MGNDISANYVISETGFKMGLWSIHDAYLQTTKQHVSFWSLDYELLKVVCKEQKIRKRYISYLRDRISDQSKIQNKHILKIYEVSDASNQLCFSSEPVFMKFGANQEKFARDEIIAIALQLANTIVYCHKKLGRANLGLCPDSVVISDTFETKLLLFQNSCSANNQISEIVQPLSPSFLSKVSFRSKYMAPEISDSAMSVKWSSDIYSYGVFLHDIFTGFSKDLGEMEGIPDEFKALISECTDKSPEKRPTEQSILESEAFSSLVSDVFNYLNKIIFTDDKDRYSFFEGLYELSDAFSTRLFMHMFMPLFVDQMDKDKRFCLIILPVIFKFLSRLDENDVISVIKEISFLFTVTRPPQISEIIMSNIPEIIGKVKPIGLFFPLLLSALESDDAEIMEESISLAALFRDNMEAEQIENELIPIVIDVIKRTSLPSVAASSIEAISVLSDKITMECIFSTVIPALMDIWVRKEWAAIAGQICDVLVKYKGTPSQIMKSSAALATMMLGNEKIEPHIQIKLIALLTNSIDELRKSRNFLSHEYKEKHHEIPKLSNAKKIIRPSQQRFNPFDSSPSLRVSKEGQIIASSSRGEISIDKFEEEEDFKSTGNINKEIGNIPLNVSHKRYGSSPTSSSVSFNIFNKNLTNTNFSETLNIKNESSSDFSNENNSTEGSNKQKINQQFPEFQNQDKKPNSDSFTPFNTPFESTQQNKQGEFRIQNDPNNYFDDFDFED